MRKLCEWKGINIIEAEVCPDHIHMLVEIPPKIAISNFMGCLKGKSSTMLYEQFGELKYKYRSREFWCRRYYVVGADITLILDHYEMIKALRTGGDPIERVTLVMSGTAQDFVYQSCTVEKLS